MHPLAYLFALVPGLCAVLGLALGGAFAWLTPVVVFVGVPLADLALPPQRRVRETRAVDHRVADVLLWAAAGLDGLVLVGLLLQTWRGGLDAVSLAGCVLSTGIILGLYGLNVGHELGHRGGRLARWTAQLLMGTSLYAHFWIEHNLGHHARVATPADPASARRGEWVFPFWARSIVGGARSALRLAPRFVVGAWIVQAALVSAVALTLGLLPALAWLGAAAVGILLLETVNYLEHYGLRRERLPSGRWERVQPRHSWNAEHPIGRAMLFDLPRHADHHAHPRRACVDLRPFAEAPELPTGYPAMILAALVPPLFMALMHPALDLLPSRSDIAAK